MDSMSYRNNRSSSGRSVEREQELKPVPASEPERRPLPESPRSPRTEKRRKPLMKIIVALLVLALLAAGAWYAMRMNAGVSSAIDSSKYQAVFFTNGQVYFGKLTPLNDEYMKLTNVFYLQTKTDTKKKDNPQATSQDGGDVELIKLGSEIHGPDDAMIVSKDQMLFFENLKSEGSVSKTISGYQQQNATTN